MTAWHRGNRNGNFSAAKRVECECEAGTHPSMLEKAVCKIMALRERAGEIRNVKRQASVQLIPGVRWKVDFGFEYVATGEPGWAEAKGRWDRGASMRLRIWKNGAGPGKLEIWEGAHAKPTMTKVVVPKRHHDAAETHDVCPHCNKPLGIAVTDTDLEN